MHTATVQSIVYVVSVAEIAFSGQRAALCDTQFSGRGACSRAIRFAEQEKRSSTTSIQVYPVGGKRRAAVWTYRNERPICPCNNPRCTSAWAAGRIRSSVEVEPLLAVSPREAVRRTPAVCEQPAERCSGNASWQWAPGGRRISRSALQPHAGVCSASVTGVPSRDGRR
jgi:hypothetical protein